MTRESRITAGILLLFLPSVMFGGFSLLFQLLNPHSGYMQNPLRQNLWRAGHAHAGVLLILSLVALRYVDEAALPDGWKWLVRISIPLAAICMPLGYFLSVLPPKAAAPNEMIYFVYLGATLLLAGLITLGVGLVRKPKG